MQEETDKLVVVSEIYSRLTEKNRENLISMAESLLEGQRKESEMAVDETAVFLTSKKKGV
jgi:K+ transporter